MSPLPAAPSPAPAWLPRAFAFAVVAFVWWRISENTADNDLWGHVLYGQRLQLLGGLEPTETLSWTASGQPWINHEVMAEVLLGSAHRLGGGHGIWVLMVTLAAGAIGWAWKAGAGPSPARRVAALALLALSANFIALGCAARPQLFTLLAFVALLVALRRFFAGRLAAGAAIPLLLVAWVNTHGGFLAGLVIVLLAIGVELAASFAPGLRRVFRAEAPAASRPALGGLAAASVLAVFVNPLGAKLVFWTFETLHLPRPTITEWAPMPLSFATIPFYFAIALGVAAWLASRQPRRLWELAVWLLVAAIAIRHQRHAPLFGLASLMLLPVHLTDVLARVAPAAASLVRLAQRPLAAGLASLALVVAGAAALRASLPPVRPLAFRMAVPRDLFPVAAIDFIRAGRLTGNTITFFDWGQQVLWELPDNPVSFDGRLDTVYPLDVMDAHWRLYAGRDPGPALDLAKARLALLPTDGGGTRWLQAHGWAAIYEDPLATVLVPRPAAVAPVRAGADAIAGHAPFPDRIPELVSGLTR